MPSSYKLLLCLCLTILSISVLVWIATKPSSVALPLFIRDTDGSRRRSIAHEASGATDSAAVPTFSLPEKNSLPFRDYIISVEKLRNVRWVTELQNHLLTLNKNVSPQLNMVFGDHLHRHLVLNWIYGALVGLKTPLTSVLVLSLDQLLCDIVDSRAGTLPVSCIIAPFETVMDFDHNSEWLSRLMVRLLVLRLINHWGYDVASYDSDAVILKNPQDLYDQHLDTDLVASASIWPVNIAMEWGFTLCAGAILLKASTAMETLWRGISDATGFKDDKDEQVVLNTGLYNVNITWKETTPLKKACSVKCGWEGRGRDNLTVYVLPQHEVCRSECCGEIQRKQFYIAHPFGTHIVMAKKVEVLQRLNAWFLSL